MELALGPLEDLGTHVFRNQCLVVQAKPEDRQRARTGQAANRPSFECQVLEAVHRGREQ